jgi:hypothetical protein
MNENKLTWIEKATISTRITKAIRVGINATKHHTKYTSRVQDAIAKAVRAEFGLQDVDPKTGKAGVFYFGNGAIRIWGVAGLSYDDPVYMLWNWPSRWSSAEKQAEHWSAPILAECVRVDMTDYLERHAAEEAIMPQLLRLEDSIASAVFAARAEARRLIASVGEPKSATLRAGSPYWEGLTSPHREAFQYILGDK